MEARATQKAVLPRLAAALPKYFTYCVTTIAAAVAQQPTPMPAPGAAAAATAPGPPHPLSTAAATAAIPVEKRSTAGQLAAPPPATPKQAYVPPHLRGRKALAASSATTSPSAPAPAPIGWRRGSRPGSGRSGKDIETSGSESDMSDVEGGGAGASPTDTYKSSRVRLAALNVLQTLVKSDAKAVQPYWRYLLPFSSPLQQNPYTPTLVTVLLYDPQPKVRSAATTTVGLLLEGPAQRAYLAVAEVRSTTSKSFLPLSLQLGQLLVSLHAGLFHSMQREANVGVLVCTLRSLAILLAAAPYERLPGTLVSQAFTQTRLCMDRLSAQNRAASESYHAVALSCLGATLSTKQPVPTMLDELRRDLPELGALPHVVQELSAAAASAACAPAIRSEALSALRGAVRNYPSAMQDLWPTVSELMGSNLKIAAETPASNLDTKALQAAYRLLEAFLQGISGSLAEIDGEYEASSAPQLSRDMTAEEVAGIWGCSIARYLQYGWRHSSPLVRSTALTVLSKLSRQVFLLLDQSQRQALLEGTTLAISADRETAVRGAACRGLGTLATFPEAVAEEVTKQRVTQLLTSALSDSSVSVRVPAAWAFANLCGTLAASMEQGSQVEPAQLVQLAGTAMTVVRDSDKVRANGTRALGNLVTLFTGQEGHEEWLPQAIQGLVSSLTTGNMKVQWNACVAATNLMKNTSAVALDTVQVRLPGLLLLLIMLVRDSPNHKIRTHSAGALMALSQRSHYGDAYADAVQVLTALLADTSRQPPPSADSTKGSHGCGRTTDGKHLSDLHRQSQATLLHLLSLGSAADTPAMRDTLLRRKSFLVSLARSAANFVSPPEAGLDRDSCAGGPESPPPHASLPQDPFGLNCCYSEDTPVGRRSGSSSSATRAPPGASVRRGSDVGGQHADGRVAIEEPVLFSKAGVRSALLGLSAMYAELSAGDTDLPGELSSLAGRCEVRATG
mmetsp:Transcript_3080/g.8745  ORF Transcript_3080/g.8745 Transcript_3080/m.8745 type:complete len:961 (+) Transcript_3080:248-3130(+)